MLQRVALRISDEVARQLQCFSQETITDVHGYLDCLNFNYCLVGNSNDAHLSTSKVFQSNCPFVNLKHQANTELCYYKLNTKHSFFDDSRHHVCGSL